MTGEAPARSARRCSCSPRARARVAARRLGGGVGSSATRARPPTLRRAHADDAPAQLPVRGYRRRSRWRTADELRPRHRRRAPTPAARSRCRRRRRARCRRRHAARTSTTTPVGPACSIEPTATGMPAPDESWDLATARAARWRAGPPRSSWPTGRDGSARPADRRRQRHRAAPRRARCSGPTARVERSVTFQNIEIGAADVGRRAGAAAAAAHAKPLTSVPDGYDAPRFPRPGFELITRSRHADGVLFFYSDGVFSASVFEQKRRLDWGALPAGGTDHAARRHSHAHLRRAERRRAVWESDGLVYTCVTDAPSDVFDRWSRSASAGDRPHRAGVGRRLRARPLRLGLSRTPETRSGGRSTGPVGLTNVTQPVASGTLSAASESETGVSRRRRRRMRRRSRSDAPPQTPWSMRYVSAYSRHSACTVHCAQMRRALSTPDAVGREELAGRERSAASVEHPLLLVRDRGEGSGRPCAPQCSGGWSGRPLQRSGR